MVIRNKLPIARQRAFAETLPMNASNKCPICGKRGKRPCPATGGVICPACCGSSRGSKLDCPLTCSFFPFGTANEGLFVQLEADWLAKSMGYVETHLGRKTMSSIVERFFSQGPHRDESATM